MGQNNFLKNFYFINKNAFYQELKSKKGTLFIFALKSVTAGWTFVVTNGENPLSKLIKMFNCLIFLIRF